jgi:hypothetical protein
MLDILTSKMERYREKWSVADLTGAAKKMKVDDAAAAAARSGAKVGGDVAGGADEALALKNAEKLKAGKTADGAAGGAKTTPEVKAKQADDAAAGKVSETKVDELTAANKKKATPEQTAKADELAKSENMLTHCKNNPKTCAALGGTAALALYMVINGKTDPAKAAGEMIGEVGKGAFGGILDGLGLGFIGDYLPYMSICCSGFMFMFMFLYMFKTFLH